MLGWLVFQTPARAHLSVRSALRNQGSPTIRFTTLTPNLGIVRAGEESYVVADLPGLIEGASEGKGLGHRFLKHTERTRVVLHVVDCAPLDESDPVENYKLICHELAAYSGTLASKPSLVALSKTDLLPDKAKLGEIIARLEGVATEIHPISAATRSGLDPLVFRLAAILKENPPDDVVPILQPQPQDEREKFAVTRDNGNYVIEGEAVVRLIAMTNLGNSEALRHLHRKLIGMGVIAELKSKGAGDGDTVRIGEFAFTYLEEE
jgi:GTP-binding protein